MVGQAGIHTAIVHADMTVNRSKVKVTGLLIFRKLSKPYMLAAMTVSSLAGLSGRSMSVVSTWYGGRPRRHCV